jgi:Flp pilus assembly protein TadD
MIGGLLAIAVVVADPSLATALLPANVLAEASQALEAGRLEQARLMIARAVANGQKGLEVDRLTADLAFASGKDAQALAGYEQLIAGGDRLSITAERAGIAALRLGDVDTALPLISRAVEAPNASWRAWNARGVIADRQRDWASADDAYRHAVALSPVRGEIANNLGWSQLLRGNWRVAAEQFEKAAATLGRSSTRVANNLELARAALASELPGRRPNETDADWAARLNDAGVAASIMGDQRRAIAAFTQALEASGSWYKRAANNLEAATASR